MIDKRTYLILFCGILGVASYFYLRPHIEFYAGGPIAESKAEIEAKTRALAAGLGFELDTLNMMSELSQHHYYLSFLKDTLGDEFTIADLNKNGVHTKSWKTIIGGDLTGNAVIVNSEQLFSTAGNLKLHYSNSGNLIRLISHRENPNPTFIKGDSLREISRYVVGDLFGYNLDDYEFNAESAGDGMLLSDGRQSSGSLANGNGGGSSPVLEISWMRKPGVTSGPMELVLNMEPVVREFNDDRMFRTEFGFRITSFAAKDVYEPVNLNQNPSPEANSDSWFNYLFFICILILTVFIFSIGLRNIFKGKVEWRRVLVVFGTITLGVYGWRAIYMMNSYNAFLKSVGYFGTTVNNILMALVLGLYATMAYISWEALARNQHQKQVDIIDALWQRKFFVKETGAGLVNGLGIGGIIIGIMAVLVYLSGDYFLQSDSQFGYAEASINSKLLTINISVFTTAWLVCMGQIGFVYSILQQWIKKTTVAGLVSILVIAVVTALLGRTFATSSKLYMDMVYYLGIAIVSVYAMKEFGLLTVFTSWWVFAQFFMIQPYLNSPSADLAYVSWAQMLIIGGLLVYGFIANHYGVSVRDVGEYIPEYEERIKNYMRVEKEIEIARESQYQLMPLQAPTGDEFDVFGFFLPSFEVGGDYFDYVLSEDSSGKATALTLAVVDVSGKAMRAAMPAVFTSGLLLSRMKYDMPADILSQVAEPIYARTDKRTFITCLLVRYDFKSRTLSVANAGHCQPVLKRDGVAEFIQTPEPRFPLGLKPDVCYRAQELTLKKGDFILMYSDGLPEAGNQKGERFGFDEVPRFIEELDTDNMTAQEIAQQIKKRVQKFSNYQLADDTTVICLKV